MKIIPFNITTFEDLHKFGLFDFIIELGDLMNKYVGKDNEITIVREYSNSPTDVVFTLSNKEQVDEFIKKFTTQY